tara:strand:+ start:1741 stop:3495 length:1755 start_codon:yes stop_codon:yes gene_type:complete
MSQDTYVGNHTINVKDVNATEGSLTLSASDVNLDATDIRLDAADSLILTAVDDVTISADGPGENGLILNSDGYIELSALSTGHGSGTGRIIMRARNGGDEDYPAFFFEGASLNSYSDTADDDTYHTPFFVISHLDATPQNDGGNRILSIYGDAEDGERSRVQIESISDFRLKGNGAGTDKYLKCIDTNGTAQWSNIEANDITEWSAIYPDSDVVMNLANGAFQVTTEGSTDMMKLESEGGIFLFNRSTSSSEDRLFRIYSENKIYANSNKSIHFENDLYWGSTHLWLQDDGQVKVQGPSGFGDGLPDEDGDVALDINGMGSGLLLVEVNSPNDNQIGIEIELSSSSTASSSWIEFQDGSNNEVRGSIQPAAADQDATNGYAWISYNSDGGPQYANYSGEDDARTGQGNARFISGAADFGEFFAIGDLEEWSDYKVKTESEPGTNIAGLPEGLVVWVRNEKFYRHKVDSRSIPMIITKRAIVVGDGTAVMTRHSDVRIGEVLSFCGKLPVLLRGKAESGDYLIASESGGCCYAVEPDSVSFDQYKACIGRAISSCNHTNTLSDDHPEAPGKETEFSLVMTAIGIK